MHIGKLLSPLTSLYMSILLYFIIFYANHFITPFFLRNREVGMTSWSLDQKSRGRAFWETALRYTNYDFEYRLAMV
jgi:hypothetical protein